MGSQVIFSQIASSLRSVLANIWKSKRMKGMSLWMVLLILSLITLDWNQAVSGKKIKFRSKSSSKSSGTTSTPATKSPKPASEDKPKMMDSFDHFGELLQQSKHHKTNTVSNLLINTLLNNINFYSVKLIRDHTQGWSAWSLTSLCS